MTCAVCPAGALIMQLKGEIGGYLTFGTKHIVQDPVVVNMVREFRLYLGVYDTVPKTATYDYANFTNSQRTRMHEREFG